MYLEIDKNMKQMMNEILLNRLLRHFREPNADYGELQRQQVEYVYARMCELVGDDLQTILGAIAEIEVELKSRKLNQLYQHLKINHMIESDLYDFDTVRPPLDRASYDKGWRV